MLRIEQVDLTELAEALGDSGDYTTWWLDPSNGEIFPWMADIGEADPAERGCVAIDHEGSRRAYADMVEFAESVSEARTRSLLLRSLEGQGAFRRFRDTIYEFPWLRELWVRFSNASRERRAISWLVEFGLVNDSDARTASEARENTRDAILDQVSADAGGSVDERDVPAQWPRILTELDAGRTVTLTRDGVAIATIEPLSPR